MNITLIAGARPNFMKIAPIIKAIKLEQQAAKNISYRLVHTGQHYDKKMSGDFFEQLGIPSPDVNLECGSGTQAEQTAAIMVKFERELLEHRPDVVLVVGDVTSTMACTITARKLCVDVVHVEAGIRSGDMSMPEEINRIVTDAICNHFFTTSESANTQLLKNGITSDQIHFVGNTMIDTLYQNLEKLQKPGLWDHHNLQENQYYLITLHRPSNVDDPHNLSHLLDVILEETAELPVVFPLHPRTKKNLDEKYLNNPKLIVVEPMGYLEFIYLVKKAKAVITDSGGITEEATVLHIPCVTLRDSTERPETVTLGSNELAGTNPANLIPYLKKIKNNEWKKSSIPPLWDGKTSGRIIKKLITLYSNGQLTMDN
ncbi:MAG: UDP-N-acetylglucosamine 2-epimerase (non-hydrolyzing) [Bacteroidota bacterium]|nr:UDP-N-acetylglucosamine 2-epimerase (non-hydrolyzing) [Bacteroidota bacterium]